MGWLWSSPPPKPEASAQSTPPTSTPSSLPPSTSQVEPSSTTETSTSTTPSHPIDPPPRPRTQDEIANAELLAYLKQVERSYKAPPPLPPDLDDDDDDDDDDFNDDDFQPPNPPFSSNDEEDIKAPMTPAHLYPSRVSCRQLFDQTFYCKSPGGQVLQVYRYGSTRNCSRHFDAFWWCLRTNRAFMSEEDRVQRIRKRYWEQDQRIRANPVGCSEDVWRQRKYRLTSGVFVDGKVPEWPEDERMQEEVRTH